MRQVSWLKVAGCRLQVADGDAGSSILDSETGARSRGEPQVVDAIRNTQYASHRNRDGAKH